MTGNIVCCVVPPPWGFLSKKYPSEERVIATNLQGLKDKPYHAYLFSMQTGASYVFSVVPKSTLYVVPSPFCPQQYSFAILLHNLSQDSIPSKLFIHVVYHVPFLDVLPVVPVVISVPLWMPQSLVKGSGKETFMRTL